MYQHLASPVSCMYQVIACTLHAFCVFTFHKHLWGWVQLRLRTNYNKSVMELKCESRPSTLWSHSSLCILLQWPHSRSARFSVSAPIPDDDGYDTNSSHTPCAGLWPKLFICVNGLRAHHSPLHVLSLVPFCRRGNQGPERLSNLSTYPESHRVKTGVQQSFPCHLTQFSNSFYEDLRLINKGTGTPPCSPSPPWLLFPVFQ